MPVKEPPTPLEALEQAQTALQEASSRIERSKSSVLQSASEPHGVTVAELAEEFHVTEEALLTFLQTAGELLGEEHSLSIEAARRGALLAAASQAWENEIGPLFGTADVRTLLGVSRQGVNERLRARKLIALLDRAGNRQYPAFQFDDGQPLPSLITAFWTVADAAVSPWTAAAWCTATDEDALQGLSPVEWARSGRDPAALARVARQDAARLDR
jgi:hypothetical protein